MAVFSVQPLNSTISLKSINVLKFQVYSKDQVRCKKVIMKGKWVKI